MSTPDDQPLNPNRYVEANKDTLVRIIKHSDDRFVRALCLAALVEYGEDPDIEQVKAEFDEFVDTHKDD